MTIAPRLLLLSAALLLAGCRAPAPAPALEATLIARPGPAQLTLKGKALGLTPQVVKVASLEEVLQITAAMDKSQLTETRVRVLSATAAEVTFLFGEGSSAMAKVLGFPRILVFDYGSALTFEVNKFDLAPAFTALLDRQAELLTGPFAGLNVFVCGHTDQSGEAGHNAVLSLQRAQAVENYLAAHKVGKALLKAQGFGSAYPVAGNDTAPGRALNRRTEIILPQ